MARIGRFVQCVIQVELAWTDVQMLSQEVVAGVSGPEIEYLPVGRQFHAAGVTFEIVGEE